VRLLARTAKAFNMPVVLSRLACVPIKTARHSSRSRPTFLGEPIDRISMNAFETVLP